MRKFIFVLLTLLLVSPFSFAMKGIIWQPQNRDSQVTDTQCRPQRWKAILIACWLPISSKPDYGAPCLA